jgi:hypothetical protein
MVSMRWFVRWSIWLLDSIFLFILSVEWGKGRGQILRGAQDDSLSFVILSVSEDLWLGRAQILRGAQDDSSAEVDASGASPNTFQLSALRKNGWA